MGLCETSSFSIFTFINANNVKFCPFLQQLCISHDEVQRFEWKNLQNDDITLYNSIARIILPGSETQKFISHYMGSNEKLRPE